MIWRRLLVTSDTTIPDLHACIQMAFGWPDSHLHRFVIYGKSYGIAYPDGMSFADDPHQVHLAAFGFRPGERFCYEYSFHIPWRHELRVEQILPLSPDQPYPVCIGDARATPPKRATAHMPFSPCASSTTRSM